MIPTIEIPECPPALKTGGDFEAIAFNVELGGLLSTPPASDIFRAWLKADMNRAFSERGLLVSGTPDPSNNFKPKATASVFVALNLFCGVYFVSDLAQGIAALEEELKRTGLFAHAEIGWHCRHELIWRRHYPKTGPALFSPAIFEWEKRVENPKMLEMLNAISMVVINSVFPPRPPVAPVPVLPPQAPGYIHPPTT
jgi:hypothetical protein